MPNAFHAPLATAALEAGKHVILDKPFALYLAEALRVAEASRKSGRLFMLGTNQRFEEGPQKVKALAEKGYFGKIYHLKASWRRRSGIPRLGTWFGNRKLAGGGCLLDIGVHMINLALYVAGVFDAECVTGAVYTRFGNRGLGGGTWGASEPEAMPFDVDDFSKALVRLKGGVSLDVDESWACHPRRRGALRHLRAGAGRAQGSSTRSMSPPRPTMR